MQSIAWQWKQLPLTSIWITKVARIQNKVIATRIGPTFFDRDRAAELERSAEALLGIGRLSRLHLKVRPLLIGREPFPTNSSAQPVTRGVSSLLSTDKETAMAVQERRAEGVSEQGSQELPGPTWILYHYPCPDGIFAALAACLYHRALKKEVRFVPNTVYSPQRVEDLSCTSQDAVYLLDFAGPQGFAERLAGKAGRVTVLDHHKTALETLPPPGSGPKNLQTLLDMKRSGATVGWDFFSAKYEREASHRQPDSGSTSSRPGQKLCNSAPDLEGESTSKPTTKSAAESSSATTPSASQTSDTSRKVRGESGLDARLDPESTSKETGTVHHSEERGPFGLPKEKGASLRRLFAYIEDADLWKWALPDSKAFSSGLKDLDIEYDAGKNSRVFEQLLELRLDDVIQRGRASLAEKDAIIGAALEKSFPLQLGGGKFGTCLAVVVTGEVARLRSELGNQLAVKSEAAGYRAIGAIAYEEPGLGNATLLKVSLRSRGEEDTTVISQAYDGGGHKNASSFIISKDLFNNWKTPDT